ncbi:MAG: hypothetical protein A2X86_20110 [Bdellovibrionales bacterium GWA2_49_15]|nr:MAG: hypothetical protein A2X86_20110 [Bdellovibrionales bacterium GWA2_49_15]HAZ11383.1 hypothetical protein [Bdellovibrionales bacterium]
MSFYHSLILISTYPGLALASEYFTPNTAVAVTDPVASVRENCIQGRDWSTKTCSLTYEDSSSYKTDVVNDALSGTAGNLVYYGTEVGASMAQVGSYFLGMPQGSGSARRQEIITLVRGAMEGKNLNGCQKACLVKCAASHVLGYQANHLPTKFGATVRVYEDGVGECTEYQKVTWDLGAALAVPVSYAHGHGHEFNSYQINGEIVYGDSQSDSCTFFRPGILTRAERDAGTIRLNAGPRDASAPPGNLPPPFPGPDGGISH